jgi:hypothetical protein
MFSGLPYNNVQVVLSGSSCTCSHSCVIISQHSLAQLMRGCRRHQVEAPQFRRPQ